jgi:hypothetical protein
MEWQNPPQPFESLENCLQRRRRLNNVETKSVINNPFNTLEGEDVCWNVPLIINFRNRNKYRRDAACAAVSGYVAFDCTLPFETFQRRALPRMAGVNLFKEVIVWICAKFVRRSGMWRFENHVIAPTLQSKR